MRSCLPRCNLLHLCTNLRRISKNICDTLSRLYSLAFLVFDFGDEDSLLHRFDTGNVLCSLEFLESSDFSCLFILLLSLMHFLISLLISRIRSFSCFPVVFLSCTRARIHSSFSFLSFTSDAAVPSGADA